MIGMLIAAGVLLGVAFPCCLVGVLTGTTAARLVGLQTAGVVTVAVLLLLAGGLARPTFVDLAVALALLAPAGSLVFVRFLEQPTSQPERPR